MIYEKDKKLKDIPVNQNILLSIPWYPAIETKIHLLTRYIHVKMMALRHHERMRYC